MSETPPSIDYERNRSGLMVAFDFDEADLEANRLGQLTDKQQKALNSSVVGYILAKANRLHMNLDIPLRVLLYSALIAMLPSIFISNDFARLAYFIVTLAVGAFVLLGLLSNKRYIGNRTRNLVRTMEGIIKLQVSGSRSRPEYLLKLNRKRFELTQNQYNLLQNGERFRLYYYRRSIVSIEASRANVSSSATKGL